MNDLNVTIGNIIKNYIFNSIGNNIPPQNSDSYETYINNLINSNIEELNIYINECIKNVTNIELLNIFTSSLEIFIDMYIKNVY
jgi:hypothetical protein